MQFFSRSYLKRICLIMLLFVVSSCATTINQSAATILAPDAQDVSPVTIDSTLTRDELLSQMLQSVEALSVAMQKADRKLATQKLEQITLISAAVRPEILASSDQLATDFDRIVALAKSSVERNRPADADKALRFLPLIIISLKNF